ncbi:uncharacterized protein LOC127800178 isoform X1 [Diospyros lotus]|uniref:uncharacterized protein LOC127800178 isoform X1 n=1 Tax=Diospyros lotus TaxID=55363 RepID=UPI00225AFF1E|nr:uncharacterized protein LOC127800178 isoform X1 [Diospyros lotus]
MREVTIGCLQSLEKKIKLSNMEKIEAWTEEGEKKKTMDTLFYALCLEEFNQVSTCKTAKEIWDKLKVTHEGTSQVKKIKLSTSPLACLLTPLSPSSACSPSPPSPLPWELATFPAGCSTADHRVFLPRPPRVVAMAAWPANHLVCLFG